jgi:hypothetical protein
MAMVGMGWVAGLTRSGGLLPLKKITPGERWWGEDKQLTKLNNASANRPPVSSPWLGFQTTDSADRSHRSRTTIA